MIPRTLVPFRLLCLTLLALAEPVPAQTNQSAPVPDRYLLVLDVSAPMRARSAAVQEAVSGMMISAMQGQLKDGDQIGIWTFNDQLHTGDFELMTWKEDKRNDLIRQVVEFVGSLDYKNQTRFEKVRPVLEELVGESKRITVILVSDGDEVIQGTPFDLAIRRYFEDNAEELKSRKVPIITVLRGYKGRLIGYRFSYPPWPMEFPTFLAEPDPVPENPAEKKATSAPTNSLSRTLVTTNRGPIVFAEPLIVSGKKTASGETARTQTTTNADAVPPNSTKPPVADAPMQPNLQGKSQPEESPETAATVSAPSSNVIHTNSAPGNPASINPAEDTHTGFWSLGKLILLGLIGATGIGGVLLLKRRPRAFARSSLITRSMDPHERKR